MRSLGLILISYILLNVPAGAQESQNPFVLKVDTHLVVRAVSVKDAKGHPVEGLAAEDFVIIEDGVPQTIRVFEFQNMDETRVASIPASPLATAARAIEFPNANGSISEPSGKPVYRDRRLLAFYFDFGAMPQTDRVRALRAAKEFIERNMTVVDRVAILTYSLGAVRLIQQFTDDRGRLLEIIRTLRDRDHYDESLAKSAFGQNDGPFDIFSVDRRLMGLQRAVGMLGFHKEAKALVYFANGIDLNVENHAQLRATLNAAVRANVSFYPIDARGLSASAPMGNAIQHSPGGIAMYTGAFAMGSMRAFQRSQDTLYTLAADSGGKAFLDSNDLTLGIVKAQRATSSYYILGYYPTNMAQDGRARRIRISLKNRSANLSYRGIYYAGKSFGKFTEADKERQLEDALLLEDPITDLTIAIELNYFKINQAKYFVPLSAKFPGNELVPALEAGAERTVLDFIGEIRDVGGKTVTNFRDKVEIDLKGDGTLQLSSNPVYYDTGFTLAPGRYTLKFLARNADTGRIGTYQTVFAVPDLSSENLQLPISSVVLSSQRVPMSDALFNAGGGMSSGAQPVNPLIQDGQKLIPGIARVYSRAQPLYVYLHAYVQDSSGPEGLVAYLALYREKQKVFETPAYAINDSPLAESGSVPIRLMLAPGDLPAGEYTCQVSVLHPRGQKAAFWQTPVRIVP